MGNNVSTFPWRKVQGIEWTEKFKDELYGKVESIKLHDTESDIGLLIIGPSEHGKSSFANSLATVSAKRKAGIVNSGCEDASITAIYRQLYCPGGLRNFWLGDIRGLTKCSVNDGLVTDIKTLLTGHMQPGYKFIPEKPLTKSSKHYIQKPKASDKVHGVIIVHSSTHTEDIQQEYKTGLRNISKLMHAMNIPRCVILTKCDILCSDTASDISKIFHSKKVQTAVDQAVDGFGVPKGDVHPVVNYEANMDEDPLKSIPFLLALKSILYRVHDHSFQKDVYAEIDDNEDEATIKEPKSEN